MRWAEIDYRPPNLRETVDRRTTVTALLSLINPSFSRQSDTVGSDGGSKVSDVAAHSPTVSHSRPAPAPAPTPPPGGVACESCDADLALGRMGDRVFVMEIQDDDCPVLAYHQRNHS